MPVVCNYEYVPLSHPGNIVMRIETQQQQSGWAMDGCTTPRSAAMDTFRYDAGCGDVGGDVVVRKGTKQQQSGWGKYGLLCRVCANMDMFR